MIMRIYFVVLLEIYSEAEIHEAAFKVKVP